MKETKEMMRALTENKKRVQIQKAESVIIKEHALDILKTVWMFVAFVVFVELICLI